MNLAKGSLFALRFPVRLAGWLGWYLKLTALSSDWQTCSMATANGAWASKPHHPTLVDFCRFERLE